MKAYELAQRAVQAFKKPLPEHLDTLEDALAERGRFEEAMTTVDSAIATVGDEQSALKQALQHRRHLYERRQPFREDGETVSD